MPFHFLRLLDQILGRLLLSTVSPLCGWIAKFLPSHNGPPRTITILKLHGGGSLLIALPALLGLREKHPQAIFTLIGTADTQKFAALTGIFDRYVLINSKDPATLVTTGIGALKACLRDDVFIDLEPHSSLAAVFTPLTFAARRIGLVKAGQEQRARGYTDAIYFNLNAPIYIFYQQIAMLLEAVLASFEACRAAIHAQGDASQILLTPDTPRPAVYISAFMSGLLSERMLPDALWIEQLQKKFGAAPFTAILGCSPREATMAQDLGILIGNAFPAARVITVSGNRTLRQAVADIESADEFWGIDSGPLHIARLLGKKCVSFWGPTNPAYRLNAIPGLNETVHYVSFPCSPCVHLSITPPCKGDNQCMKTLFNPPDPAPFIKL